MNSSYDIGRGITNAPKLFTRQHLQDLQAIVQGEYYSEVVITKAISNTDNQEVRIMLQSLLYGSHTHELRMELQHFICDETAKLKQ